MLLVNVTLPWYHAVLHKKPRSGSRRAWNTRELTVLKKVMLRAVYAVCNVLLSLISFPLACISCWTASESSQVYPVLLLPLSLAL